MQVASAKYEREKFAKVSAAEGAYDVPMTREAFKCHCTSTLGLTEAEWTEWWDELLETPAIKRDNGGFRGRLQLHIPNALVYKKREREKGITEKTLIQSKEIKDPTAADIEMLDSHVDRQNLSYAQEWLSANDMDLSVRKRMSAADAAASSSTSSANKKRKVLDPLVDPPKLFASMEKARPSKHVPSLRIL